MKFTRAWVRSNELRGFNSLTHPSPDKSATDLQQIEPVDFEHNDVKVKHHQIYSIKLPNVGRAGRGLGLGRDMATDANASNCKQRLWAEQSSLLGFCNCEWLGCA